jgi:ATP-binding cassette, subfamily B, multidrug efflux pump
VTDSRNRETNTAGPGRGRPGGGGPGDMRHSVVGTGAKARDFRGTARRLLATMRPYYAKIVIVAILGVLSTALTVAAPKILGWAVDVIYKGFWGRQFPAGVTREQAIETARAAGHNTLADMLSGIDFTPGLGVDMATVTKIILIVAAVQILSSLFMYLQSYIMASVVMGIVYRLRRDVDLKLARLPLKYFDDNPRGDILSRVTNDIDNIQQTLQQTLTQILNSILTLVGTLGIMFWMSPLLAGISMVVIPLSVIVTAIIAKKSQKQFTRQWARTGTLNGHVEEIYTGHNIVKVFGRQREAIRSFDEQNNELYKASFKAQFISGLIMPALMVITNLNYVAVCVLGGLRVAAGTMSLGEIQAFIQYARQFTQPITQVASVANVLQSAMASSERVFEVLDEPEEVADPATPAVLREVQGHVRLEDVSFRYLPDAPLIEDLNLDVPPGQMVAIVGPTGAGKTTLVNLLMRFYEIDRGEITIDGVDTRSMTRDDLRRLFGMVLQDTWLFGGTIRENIAYGKEDATEEDIRRAAEAAHVDHFVRTLPDGYDTRLDDDSTSLSQGERQLMTIARAFLADPEILILDEATSSVDTRTEVLVQKAMAELLKGRTSFVIAHRLSTIRDANMILVMNEGRIIEQGSHCDLLAARGFYYNLYNSQFTGAMVEAC